MFNFGFCKQFLVKKYVFSIKYVIVTKKYHFPLHHLLFNFWLLFFTIFRLFFEIDFQSILLITFEKKIENQCFIYQNLS